MNEKKVNTKNGDGTLPSEKKAIPQSMPLPPLRFNGGNLGIGMSTSIDTYIRFVDREDRHWQTKSVELILLNIDRFPDVRDRQRLLMGTALHYGLKPWALIPGRRDEEPRYDVFDEAGRLLLIGATHKAASLAADQCMHIPGWSGDIRICRQHDGQPSKGLLWDWRHEGPLKLLHHSLGSGECTGVQVHSHVGGCGMKLEECLRRLGQFSADDQSELLAGVARHFGVAIGRQCERDFYPPVAQVLFYGGGNLGLGEALKDTYFWVKQNGRMAAWSVFQTLARLAEFSPAAQKRILSDCALQAANDATCASTGPSQLPATRISSGTTVKQCGRKKK